MPKPRVLLADDHTLLLEAFRTLLEPECDVVGAVSNGRELLAAADTLRPDIVIVDVAMPLLNGIDATRQLKRAHPLIKVVILTMHEEPEVVSEAFKAGASAFLLKRSAASEIRTAIHEVMQHRSFVTSLVAAALIQSGFEPARETPVQLTPRQKEVVQLVAEGHSLKEMAAILNISPRTVAFHKYRTMEQLQTRTTAELIQYAVRHRIV